MNSLYAFPRATAFGKMLTKSKIYARGMPSNKIKDLFIKDIEKIIWSHKLAPNTINLPASDCVQEIQIFTILLRREELSPEVLHTIDKAIPSPILFELRYGGKTKYALSYKRPNLADKRKWVLSSYFLSDWIKEDTPPTRLPVVLNMGALYQSFLTSLIPLPFRQEEKLDDLVERVDRLRTREREAEKVNNLIKTEKQFNRRVELNRTLNELKQEIEELRN